MVLLASSVQELAGSVWPSDHVMSTNTKPESPSAARTEDVTAEAPRVPSKFQFKGKASSIHFTCVTSAVLTVPTVTGVSLTVMANFAVAK